MEQSQNFWNAYGHLVLVSTEGALTFTQQGRKELVPKLMRLGFPPPRDVATFKRLMREVLLSDLQANTEAMLDAANDTRNTFTERSLMRQTLRECPTVNQAEVFA